MLFKALCCTMTVFTMIGLIGGAIRRARGR